jgi:hypothetical protein
MVRVSARLCHLFLVRWVHAVANNGRRKFKNSTPLERKLDLITTPRRSLSSTVMVKKALKKQASEGRENARLGDGKQN